ncbi:hypothetical protein B9Z19DRAFT_1120035 [Tuber borchii]|uniref:Uncharacterized protein n=1 Tax=Tuber borchii TaxID=42251 RepID=A0A2T7A5I1_TUBBO|nr:hypothetical protein B9Z19DRAFT_1120035 [Tuber borchii]
MGNVASPAKDVIFYPDVARYIRDDDGAGLAKLDSLKDPLALRALGAIGASDVSLKAGISVSRTAGCSTRLNYNSNVTRVDIVYRVVVPSCSLGSKVRATQMMHCS